MSKSENILSSTTSFCENCMYLKLTYFLFHNLKLFSEKSYKKQAQVLIIHES